MLRAEAATALLRLAVDLLRDVAGDLVVLFAALRPAADLDAALLDALLRAFVERAATDFEAVVFDADLDAAALDADLLAVALDADFDAVDFEAALLVADFAAGRLLLEAAPPLAGAVDFEALRVAVDFEAVLFLEAVVDFLLAADLEGVPLRPFDVAIELGVGINNWVSKLRSKC